MRKRITAKSQIPSAGMDINGANYIEEDEWCGWCVLNSSTSMSAHLCDLSETPEVGGNNRKLGETWEVSVGDSEDGGWMVLEPVQQDKGPLICSYSAKTFGIRWEKGVVHPVYYVFQLLALYNGKGAAGALYKPEVTHLINSEHLNRAFFKECLDSLHKRYLVREKIFQAGWTLRNAASLYDYLNHGRENIHQGRAIV